jgi:uncharacterized tellurite resistance protein B-like protein
MLESIKRFFDTSMPPAGDEKADPKDLRLAACALLLELAHADDHFSDEERRHLEGAIRRHIGLDATEAERLLALAEEARAEAVDLWQFTNLIAEHYSLGQKMVLAEVMWGLVYSDGKLASKEDYLMRKISNLLRLEPGYLAEARKRVEDAEMHVRRFEVPD